MKFTLCEHPCHRAEERQREELTRQHDQLVASHERHVNELRERHMREQEDLVSRERSASSARVQEALDRQDQQLSAHKMRFKGIL